MTTAKGRSAIDKVVVTVLLIISGVVCSIAVFNGVYSAIGRSSGAMITIAGRVDDRIKSQIEIIQAAEQGDDVFVWVKNVGASRIEVIEQSDIFFGEEGDFSRIAYGEAGSAKPYWDYKIENDATEWGPTTTLKITIHLNESPSGTCFIKVVIPNGISDEHQFSTQA